MASPFVCQKCTPLQPKQLLPICCQYMYANFASEVRGAICITMAGLFDCQKVRPIVYMRYSMINIWYMHPYLLPYLPLSAKAWSVLVVLVILGTRTGTKTDFDMGEELFSLIYLVLLYYILVVLVVLVKSKVLRKFLNLFLWYTFGIYMYKISMIYADMPIEKKSKKS